MELGNLLPNILRHGESTITVRGNSGDIICKNYVELHQDICHTAALLSAMGLTKGSIVGIYAENSYEWVVFDIACIELGIMVVAFSEDTFSDSPQGIFTRYSLSALFTDKDINPDANPAIVQLRNILRASKNVARIACAAPPAKYAQDDFSICFSSGSTGNPKAIVVSRLGAEYIVGSFLSAFRVSASDKIYIFLPLSNFQQRLLVYACLHSGASISFTVNQYLFGDFKEFKPTFFVAPPVLFQNILTLHQVQKDTGQSLHDMLGGGINFILVGMAPIEPGTIRAFHDAGIMLLESYGLSETGVIAWNTRKGHKIGTVGLPLNRREVTFSADNEILIEREFPLCSRYLESNDALVFRHDGSIATGDTGYLDGDGYLVLTGRKKNIVITTSGHKFQPEMLEKEISDIHGVNSVILYHASKSQKNIAIINVVNKQDPALMDRVHTCIEGINQDLLPHKRIGKILINDDTYSENNQLLTGNLKLNRSNIIKKYAL